MVQLLIFAYITFHLQPYNTFNINNENNVMHQSFRESISVKIIINDIND